MNNTYRRNQIIDHSSPFFVSEYETTTSIFPFKSKTLPTLLNPFLPPPSLINHHEPTTLDLLLNPAPTLSLLDFPTPFDPFCDSVTDLIQIETTPFCSYNYKRRVSRVNSSELYLRELCDRVSALESKFDRLVEVKRDKKKLSELDRKYSWTAEIKGGVDRKYKWTAEIEGDDEKKGRRGERKYQWVTEIKGKDDEKKTYTLKATVAGDKKEKDQEKEKQEKKVKKSKDAEKGSSSTRIVEIEEPSDHGAVVLRQAFAKRAIAAKDKGKKKELSRQDAAAMIQMTFRGYLIRRSKALRALRELAVAKTKLKELRALFHNFSYRSRVARDAEERQKFSERIIVLLLTVDAIEGVDLMVRAAKRSMVDELEAMLDVVDPQPAGRSLSMRRRTFDMPTGSIQKEIAEGVAQVVQMIEEEDGAFEACL